jgi:hypothetical protein
VKTIAIVKAMFNTSFMTGPPLHKKQYSRCAGRSEKSIAMRLAWRSFQTIASIPKSADGSCDADLQSKIQINTNVHSGVKHSFSYKLSH